MDYLSFYLILGIRFFFIVVVQLCIYVCIIGRLSDDIYSFNGIVMSNEVFD